MKRRGLGKGMGKGYKNMIPKDPIVHSLNAKGISQKKELLPIPAMNTDECAFDFGDEATPQKRGLIKEIARKANDGVTWAIEWEKKHLPKQKAWVKNEYRKAKELARKGLDKIQDWSEKRKQDLDDVRDELDIDDDGVQDISIDELEEVNYDIVQDLQNIDEDGNKIPDYKEYAPLNPDMKYEYHPVGFLFPSEATNDKKFGTKVKDVFVGAKNKVGEYIKQRRETQEEIRSLSNAKLKDLAVKEGKPIFGSMNKYEKELVRRAKYSEKVKQELKQAEQGNIKNDGFNPFGFLNPIGTIKSEKK